MDPELIVAACFVVLAVAHSALGEKHILQPLFGADWSIPQPRWPTQGILRFAWHITSIAWLTFAAIVVGGEALPFVAIMSLWSAAIIFVMLRDHLAWPIFLLAGLAALRADGLLESGLMRVGAIATALVLLATAGLHVYWVLGGRWLFDLAVPKPEGVGDGFTPGTGLTLLVAASLGAFAALVIAVGEGYGPESLRWLVGAGVAVFAVRAIGDTNVAGFTKKERNTDFAKADDRWFTPLVVFLALGATGALLV